MSKWQRFQLLIWKNYLLQKRAVLATVIELGLPTLLAAILLILRTPVVYEVFPNPKIWPTVTIDYSPTFEERGPWKLMYAPETPVTSRVMNTVLKRLMIGRQNPYNNARGGIISLLPFQTDADMEAFIGSENRSTRLVYGGISFTNIDNPDVLPNKVKYSIRPRAEGVTTSISGIDVNIFSSSSWFTDFLVPLGEILGPRLKWSASGGVPAYWGEGFFQLVYELDRAVGVEISENVTKELWDAYQVEIERYPYPPYVNDPFIFVIQRQFPFVLLMSFIVTVFHIVKNLVLEKERKLKELMKLMGLSNSMYWGSWLVKYVAFMLISVIVLTVLFSVSIGGAAIVNATHPTVLFFFMFLYAICTLCFCCLISVFFKKANNGALAAGVIFFFSYLPYNIFEVRYEEVTLIEKVVLSLFHNVAMSMGCKVIGLHEGTGAGLQWGNLHKKPTLEEDYTMIISIMFLVGDSILYMLLAVYLDQLFPGEYGIAKRWYFPFQRSYWCCGNLCRNTNTSYDLNRSRSFDGERTIEYSNCENIEAPEGDLKPGIIIKDLTKEFGSGERYNCAVNKLNLEMFEGQITALLGHNGAGKTTTISMLTGFVEPSSGDAFLDGHNITENMDMIRNNLGLCPQQDVLFDSLTVYEHLEFFAMLKGCANEEVRKEVEDMIELLQLVPKKNTLSCQLSGGMKRKLCVGIALIAGSKIVILDEPTSGVDPSARRQLWDILQSQRQGRTLLLTTHFMDEADHLGDRIAIMAEGKLQACGSSLFLKKKFGVGYHMVLVKSPSCRVSEVTSVLQRFVSDAALESDVAAELSYVIPDAEQNNFEGLFAYFEENSAVLGVSSYGISLTTMEEVFLRINRDVGHTMSHSRGPKRTSKISTITGGYTNASFTRDEPEEAYDDGSKRIVEPEYATISEPDTNGNANDGSTEEILERSGKDNRQGSFSNRVLSDYGAITMPADPARPYSRPTGLAFQQFRAMFIKRVIHSARNLLITIVQLILPLAFAILGCVILELFPEMTDPPPLTMTIDDYMDRAPQYVMYQSRTIYDNITITPEHLGEYYSRLFTDKVTSIDRYYYDGSDYGDPSRVLRDEILKVGETSMDEYNTEHMVSASFYDHRRYDQDRLFHSGRVVGFFNNQAYHTCVVTLSYVTNALLQAATGGTHHTEVTNHPFPRQTSQMIIDEAGTDIIIAFIVVSTVSFGMSFLVGTFVVFLIKERTTKAKHIQVVSGVNIFTYWLSTFSWDFINYLFPSCFLLVVFAAFQIDAYADGVNILYVFLTLLLYGWAILPFVYLFSFLFDVPSSGYIWTTILNVFIGTTALLVVTTLKYPELDQEEIGRLLEWVFYVLLPNFAFSNSLQSLFLNHNNKETCKMMTDELCQLGGGISQNFTNPCCPGYCNWCLKWQNNALAWEEPGIGRGVVFMILQGIMFFIGVALLESGIFRRVEMSVRSAAKAADPKTTPYESEEIVPPDVDVALEKERVETTSVEQLATGNPLILQDIQKNYGSMRAVKGISLAVPYGECFGLLGVNGAGKTSLFKMLTGDEIVSGGDAYVDSYNVRGSIKKAHRRLGYCPQFDALIDQMTVKEHLTMFGRLRGLSEKEITESNNKIVDMLLLKEHVNKQSKNLSGGNKRKLSTGLALVADLPVIFLDEPTTGMDPVASRHVWKVLHRLREAGRTIILTSHSMEECEALCTRLAIMVNGQFKCLGSTQHLKAKFSEGYVICVKLKSDDESNIADTVENYRNFIQLNFPGAIVKDVHGTYVDYILPDTEVKLSRVFGLLESNKLSYQIEDYSVSQTTLEQVFITFARAQVYNE